MTIFLKKKKKKEANEQKERKQLTQRRKKVLLRVQYLGAKPFGYHCLKQILNQSPLLEPLMYDCSVGHSESPVKLVLKTVFLECSVIQ